MTSGVAPGLGEIKIAYGDRALIASLPKIFDHAVKNRDQDDCRGIRQMGQDQAVDQGAMLEQV